VNAVTPEQAAEARALIAEVVENDADEFEMGSDWHERARKLLIETAI